MSKENEIKLGPTTTNLLMALRAIESARNYYYEATEATRGEIENLTDHLTQEENSAFDNLRELVEKEIGDNIRTWAFSNAVNNEI